MFYFKTFDIYDFVHIIFFSDKLLLLNSITYYNHYYKRVIRFTENVKYFGVNAPVNWRNQPSNF